VLYGEWIKLYGSMEIGKEGPKLNKRCMTKSGVDVRDFEVGFKEKEGSPEKEEGEGKQWQRGAEGKRSGGKKVIAHFYILEYMNTTVVKSE